MIIFIYGPDSYRRQEKLKEIINEYKKTHSVFSVENFDMSGGASSANFEKLKEFIKAKSLFDDFKLGIMTGICALEKQEQKDCVNLLRENLKSKEQTLIISEDKELIKDFKFLLEKPVLFQQFENLTGIKLRIFLQKEAAERSLTIDQESRNLLMQIHNSDTWGLITELDKLAFLDYKEITQKMLEKYIDISLPINIFAMLNQMKSARFIKDRLALLEELFIKSADPAMIFNMLSSFTRTSEEKKKMADYDAAIKSGKLEYEEVLTDLAISD